MAEEQKDKKHPETEKKEVTKEVKKERPTNCAMCNKAFKYKRWYYKNGSYFCNKKCWKKFDAEQKKKLEEQKAAKEAQKKEAAEKEAAEKAALEAKQKEALEKTDTDEPEEKKGEAPASDTPSEQSP